MQKKLVYKVVFGISLLVFCDSRAVVVRTDVEDRKPEEVRSKSYSFAENNPLGKVTGAIFTDIHKPDETTMSTGIALDRYTIITSAHGVHSKEPKRVIFKLNADAQNYQKGKDEFEVSKIILHEDFKAITGIVSKQINFVNNEYLEEKIIDSNTLRVDELSKFNFDQLMKRYDKIRNFLGIDLAIIKLSKPLSEKLAYPEIPDWSEIKETYAHALGFGHMKFNYQDKGSEFVDNNIYNNSKRHLYSIKVNSSNVLGEPWLYGDYRGLLINGGESFIPNNIMMKSEGLPTGGDSGGPLIIENKLVGIMSETFTIVDSKIEDETLRKLLKHYEQPIYPVYVDLRAHKEWILKHMVK